MATLPFNQPMTGNMTWYDTLGIGACGQQIDPATQDFVAVPSQWWSADNPNNDPLCQGISVKVTYNGKTITLPIMDKCPACEPTHLDVSKPAFAKLAPLDEGNVQGVTWEFVRP